MQSRKVCWFRGLACDVQGEDKGYQVCKKKMDTNAEMLCLKGWPSAFRVFMEAVLALKYDEEPKYDAYMALFRPLTGHGASRPLTIFPVEEPPPKKVRGSCLAMPFGNLHAYARMPSRCKGRHRSSSVICHWCTSCFFGRNLTTLLA